MIPLTEISWIRDPWIWSISSSTYLRATHLHLRTCPCMHGPIPRTRCCTPGRVACTTSHILHSHCPTPGVPGSWTSLDLMYLRSNISRSRDPQDPRILYLSISRIPHPPHPGMLHCAYAVLRHGRVRACCYAASLGVAVGYMHLRSTMSPGHPGCPWDHDTTICVSGICQTPDPPSGDLGPRIHGSSSP